MTAAPKQDRRVPPEALIVAVAVFLLVAGIGAATSYWDDFSVAAGAEDTRVLSPGGDGAPDDLQRLSDYARSGDALGPGSAASADQLLPDVDTMIEQLAARLKTAPNDVAGWRMLGWSYFQTGRYREAAAAYARALALDPSSPEIERAYEDAKAKASESGSINPVSSLPAHAAGKDAGEAGPARQDEAAIRSMVDGLGGRLESSPRDVDGWTLLMRSRVVLGETEGAKTALRKALEVFKDDPAASREISDAAVALGLKTE